MKKLIIALLFIVYFSTLSFATELPIYVVNATNLHIYLRSNFYYAKDRTPQKYWEYWQSPEIFQKTRVGDCDDFAIFVHHWLKKLGYEAKIYVFFGINEEERYGHAVCVFRDNDEVSYSIFSNQYIFPTLQLDPIEAIKELYSDWVEINEWNPTKYGFITWEEGKKTLKLVAKKDLTIEKLKNYLNKEKPDTK